MITRVGAVVLTARDLDATVAFYRAAGLPLEREQHDDGPVHYACDVDGCHVAVFPAREDGGAPGRGVAGSTLVGFAVTSVDEVLAEVSRLGVAVLEPPSDYPWGLRALVEDPDGRPVEL
jgi:lactoylglutathione lyase